jgi:carboxyl-terminal processing protease
LKKFIEILLVRLKKEKFMKKRYIKSLVIGFAAVLLLTGFFTASDVYFEISKNIDLFGKIYKEVSFNYVDEIDPEEFMEAGIQGMLNSLDPYTVYMDESRKDEIELITNGKYGGVGISVGVRGDKVTIVEVYDGYSAQRQGLKVGDVIIEANGENITAEKSKDLSKYVKGEPGTKVDVKILRNLKDTIDFNLVREEIIIKNVTFYGFIPEESNNAYIKLSGFSRSAGEEVRRAVKDLKNQKPVESVVLDLRGNPGGLLDIAIDISNKFLPPKTLIVSTKGRTEESLKKYLASQEPILPQEKLVVLVNENSASASEIVAGAIQDNDRGVIVGAKTFGKGLVQTVTPLSLNTSLKITTSKYYTPSGRLIQKVDYSKKNKIFSNTNTTVNADSEYFTINRRSVYGSGGITPDSIVKFKVESNLAKELLAKGMFFSFADKYYYENPDADFSSIDDKVILDEFNGYIDAENFKYVSEAEKQVDKLIRDIKNSSAKEEFNGELENIKSEISKISNAEMRIFRNEIVREIKSELASRYLGSTGRTKEMLSNDEQFRTALSILKDQSLYNKLLANGI